MLKFEKEQKVFDIAGVKLGGQPGEYPTVLIGTIFYDKHKIISDEIKGTFDRSKAEDLLKKQEVMSEKTGNPIILDVPGHTSEALTKYVDFVSEKTSSPFLVDCPLTSVRVSVMRHLAEAGLLNRAVYNSIDYTANSEEISALREIGVKSSIVMAHNPANLWAEGRVEILKQRKGQMGLLESAKEAGIQTVLVDTAVLDVPSIGPASEAINRVRNEFGLPAGCAPANAITTWRKIRKEMGPYAYNSCLAGSCTFTQLRGASFVFYGPIEGSEVVFPACAMTDALIAYNARRLGVRPKIDTHPISKIF